MADLRPGRISHLDTSSADSLRREQVPITSRSSHALAEGLEQLTPRRTASTTASHETLLTEQSRFRTKPPSHAPEIKQNTGAHESVERRAESRLGRKTSPTQANVKDTRSLLRKAVKRFTKVAAALGVGSSRKKSDASANTAEQRTQPLIESIAQETAARPGPRRPALAELLMQPDIQEDPIVDSDRRSSGTPQQHATPRSPMAAAVPVSPGREPEVEPHVDHTGMSMPSTVESFSEPTSRADDLHESNEDLFEIDLNLPSASASSDDDDEDLFDLDLERASHSSTTEPVQERNSTSASSTASSFISPGRETELETPSRGSGLSTPSSVRSFSEHKPPAEGSHERDRDRKSKGGKRKLASGLQFGVAVGIGGSYNQRRPHKADGSLPSRTPLDKLKKEEIENGATPHAIAASVQDTVAPSVILPRHKKPGPLKRGATTFGWSRGKIKEGHYGWNMEPQFTPAKGGAVKMVGTEGGAAALAKKSRHLNDLGELVSSSVDLLSARLQAAEEVCGAVLSAYRDAVFATRHAHNAELALRERQENLKRTEEILREELSRLTAQHAQLTVDLADMPEPPPIPIGDAAVGAFHRQMAETLLMQAKAARERANHQLERSYTALRETREEIKTYASFSLERIKAGALISQLEAEHQHNLDCFAQAERDVFNSETRFEEQKRDLTEVDIKIREYQELLTQRAPIEEELAHCHDMLNAAQLQFETVQRDLVTNEADIDSARQAQESARLAEREVKFQFDSERAAVRQLHRQLADFREHLLPIQHESAAMQVRAAEAGAAEAALQGEEAQSREEAMRTLIQAPPVFGPSHELSAMLTELRVRLETNLDKSPAAAQLPVAETLEIVTRSLALETRGNAAEASRLLHELMHLPFTALVPPPGQPIVDWAPARLVGRLAGMACGVETLLRITSNEGVRPEPAQMSALPVYYKAERAVMELLQLPKGKQDAADLVWLTSAAQAAKRLIHAREGGLPLSTIELTAFNGVRNGFTSIAKGSDYDRTNQRLKDVAVWLQRAKETRTMKHSPLSGRLGMQAVGFDVGLPTVEHALSTTLEAACNALLQRTTAMIIDARPEPSDALLRAATLLNRAAKLGRKHQRWDTLKFGRGDWRRIKRDAKDWAHRERVPGKVPRALRDAAQTVHQAGPESTGTESQRSSTSRHVDFAALDAALLTLATKKETSLLNVLQTLQPILTAPTDAEQVSVDKTAPEHGFTVTGTPLPTIEEEEHEEPGEWVLDEVARDRTAQAHTSKDQSEHEAKLDAELADIRRRLDAVRMMEPMLEPSPVPDEIGVLVAKAAQLQKQSDDFTRRSRLDSNALQTWLAPVVSATSGSLSTSQGTTYGLSTSGLNWAVNRLGRELVGLTITADAEVTRGRQHELGVKRDSKGLNLLIGENTQWTGKLGGIFSVGIPPSVKKTRDKFTIGLRLGYKRGASSTQAHGVAVREPKSGDMVKNFEDMLHTLLNWSRIENEDRTPAFSDPLAALLARHPTISVGETSAQTKAFTADGVMGIGFSVSGRTDINKKPGAVGTGSEWRIGASNATTAETIKGAQVIDSHTRNRSFMNSVRFTLSAAFAPSISAPRFDVRPRTLSVFLEKTLRLSSAQEAFKWVSMPDGTLVADRAVEFSSFKKFKQQIDSHREEWIAHVIRSTKWPEGLSPAAIRLCVEDDLNHFMARAKMRIRNGDTVTLNETMDVKPEVCARLTALANAGALAAEQGFEDDADKHLQKIKDLLSDDTSYKPYKAKVIVRSDIALSWGTDWGIVVKSETRARGMNETETWPR